MILPRRLAGSLGLDDREALAVWISRVFSPPSFATLNALLVGGLDGRGQWPWVAGYVLVSIALPLGFVVYLLRNGAVSDLDLSRRRERLLPYLATVIATGIIFAILVQAGPWELQVLAAASLVQLALLLAITVWWMISVHAASATAAAVLAWAFAAPLSAAFLTLVPVVCWSRIVLRRHTLAQTVAGAVLGGGVIAIAIPIF